MNLKQLLMLLGLVRPEKILYIGGSDVLPPPLQVAPEVRLRDVVRHAGQRVGIVVDTLLGEFQTVIKPLGPLFTGLSWISGATMLGDGGIALILLIGAVTWVVVQLVIAPVRVAASDRSRAAASTLAV